MKKYTVVADLHNHTIASDHAYSTITEIAAEAARKGLAAVGCTDHGPAIPDSPSDWHFGSLHNLTDYIEGVRVFRGIEANVLDENGHIDYHDEGLARLEVVIASMHGGVMTPNDADKCTAAWLAVANNPNVDIIGHCGTPEFTFDYERVIPEFGRLGKAVEINENSFLVRSSSIPNCVKIAELCKRHNVSVFVNSDSHFHAHLGDVHRSFALLEEIDFPPELIVNGSVEGMNSFFSKKNIII